MSILGDCHPQEATVDEFIEKYQLRDSEVTSLREGDIDGDFFAALEKAQAIHQDCKGLLQAGKPLERAGLEIVSVNRSKK